MTLTKVLPDIFTELELEDALAKINITTDIAVDTETIGLYGKIRLLQLYQRHWDKAIIVEYPNPYQLFAFFSKHTSLNLVMQNSSYDVSTIQAQIGAHFAPHSFDDTLLLARLAFPHLEKYSLDYLITHVLDHDPYKDADIDKDAMHKTSWSVPVLTHKQKYYAALDVFHLFTLYDRIKDMKESLSYKLDMHALRSALQFQCNGLPVDKERLQRRYAENLKAVEEINLPINCNSYQQVRPYIGSNESDALGLAKLAMAGNDRAANVRKARKLIKQNSFLSKFDTEDGLIYGKFAPNARSGRFTCKDQNLEQLPRDTKDMFGYRPDEGSVLIYSDYPQLELRGAAAITGDRVMCEALYEHKDLHDITAAYIFGDVFTKEERRIAKTANFNLLYGGGAKMFQSILIEQAGVFLELDAIQRIIRKWKRLYKGIADWQQRGIRAYQRGSLGSTPFGRRYKAKMMTDQLNIECQGFGAEVAKLAMHYMSPKLIELFGYNNILNFIHDAFINGSPDDAELYKPAAVICADAMGEAWREACGMVRVKDLPMPVEVAVGYNWGDIENEDLPNLYDYKKVY